MKAIKKRLFFLNPITWAIWLALGSLWLITRLPYSWQKNIGIALGNIIYLCSSKLKHITTINLKLCFPQLTDAEIIELSKKNFASLGLGLIETAMAWWLPERRLEKCAVKLTGIEHAEQAFANGKGIILLSPHSTCLEMIGRLIGSRYPLAAMYRPHKIPAVAKIQQRFRQRYGIRHIARHRMRELIHTFNDNMAIWYAYDIDAGEKRSVFAPFFGIQTASLTAVSRLVELTGTTIIPIEFFRLNDEWGYQINLSPALQNFPSGDLTQDASRLNKHLENAIRNKPEQYIWQYKRFKSRPAGEARFY
jgi:Kdo2-lipid IVA lauroyltransferase/acyltransferase